MRDQPSSWLKPRGAMPTQSTNLVQTIKSKKLVQTIKAAKLDQITPMEKVGFHSNLRESYMSGFLERVILDGKRHLMEMTLSEFMKFGIPTLLCETLKKLKY
jgi:hypothetical protein